jgi:type IV pilus assembly protein PilC
MAMFRYQAMTAAGVLVGGRLYAANLADLEARLLRLGLDLIDGRAQRPRIKLGRAVPRRALIDFCFHLEQLSNAGVPLIDGLKDLRDSTPHPGFHAILAALVENVEGGKRLSEAMASHRRTFDPVIISLVRAGEDSGKLTEVLAELVSTLKWQDELAAHARRVALYPAVLILATLGLLWFMMLHVVPKLTGFMKDMNQQLPWHTEALIAVSGFTVAHWPMLLSLPAVAAIAVGVAVKRSPRVRYLWDAAKLRVPLLGGIHRKLLMARLAGVLGLLYGAGIPVLEALQSTERVVGNAFVERSVRRANRAISSGAGIAAAFDAAGLFPPLLIRMLRVGETTGSLDRALANVTYFFNRDVRESVEQAQAVIEPAMIVVIGAIIGWIMLSVLGPIYDLIAQLGV